MLNCRGPILGEEKVKKKSATVTSQREEATTGETGVGMTFQPSK
jgi:hypothetical protein